MIVPANVTRRQSEILLLWRRREALVSALGSLSSPSSLILSPER
uniref:Uncharacterized protein n=1 Tax=Brassica oleracea TaxID=3712 RepID=A0A3P6AQI7_BRAOL|nr:unnamed protein product [Brassica oleracea]